MKAGIAGSGVFGVAAAIELRRRGHEVTVFEQDDVPGSRAGSTDVAKAIRKLGYGVAFPGAGTKPVYVELVEQAARQWREWERTFSRPVYHQVGQMLVDSQFRPGMVVHDTWKYLTGLDLKIPVLSKKEARARFPQFEYLDGEVVVYDPWAGYIESGSAVAELAAMARRQGVVIHEQAKVTAVRDTAKRATVCVQGEDFSFDRVVVAAGTWLGRLAPAINKNIRVTRQQMVFFQLEDTSAFAPERFPAWGVDIYTEGWYGFPLLRDGRIKVSSIVIGDVVDPDEARDATAAFIAQTKEFVARRIPALKNGTVVGARSCFYDNTPDEDFIVDWAPGMQRVLLAGGGSGHGFKFGGSIGPVIADALEDKDNPLGKEFRLAGRFGT
ncbi:MAG: FAD-dependent oxidoreductase [SAR202 cluster bacterium]|nr:FAD-dependent oxidoreductase [SAR202 cluster bacterium]